jgi:restriction system protein
VRFATIAPVKAGWLIKSKSRWILAEEGKKAYESIQDPEKFVREGRRLYRQWAESRPDTVPEVEDEGPDATSTIEEAEESAWSEIENYMQKMPPYDFQNLVAALLRAMGYHVSWIAPPGPDKGIDILAHTDPLGTSVPRIKVQVKRRADKISAEGLRSFMAVLSDQDVGIFVSTGGFTNDPESEARTQERRKVTLVDLEKLFDLWVQHYEKVAESDKLLLPLKPVYYLAPTE